MPRNGGIVSIGDLPECERPLITAEWHEPDDDLPADRASEPGFVDAVKAAVARGVGLKDIGRAASSVAIRIVLEQEDGNLQRAARRLGVTDRALQDAPREWRDVVAIDRRRPALQRP